MNTQDLKLLNKEELEKFNLYQLYWVFLKSLQNEVILEIQKRTSGVVESCLKLDMFDESGDNTIGLNAPENDELYFQLKNRKSSIRLYIANCHTQNIILEFLKGNEVYVNSEDRSGYWTIEKLFSDKIFAAIVLWLRHGDLSPDLGGEFFKVEER